jgi:hypothetical protein
VYILLVKGEFRLKSGRVIRRDELPFVFWSTIAAFVVLFLAFLVSTVGGVLEIFAPGLVPG